MNIVEFTDRFLAFERELELFSNPDWDPLRYDLFYRTYHALNGTVAAETASESTMGKRLRRVAGRTQRSIMRHRLLGHMAAEPRDVLILQASRQSINGIPADPAIAPLASLTGINAHVIDSVPRYYHLPETGGPPTLPVARKVTEMAHALAALRWDTPADDRRAEVGADDLLKLAGEVLACFERKLRGYHRLLDAAKPKLIIANQNGIEKSLFRAAHQRGLPVIETQHGLIGYGHPGYSYSPDLDYSTQDTLPDVFVTFAEHWTRSLHYPVRRIVPLGNDAMLPTSSSSNHAEGMTDAVLILSADIYHKTLSDWTRQVALARPDKRFIYKLHPNQQAAAPAIVAAMADIPNIRVVDGKTRASDLLQQVGHMVVVQSTAMYEALQLGIPLLVVAVQNYEIGKDVFDLPQVSVVKSPGELAGRLDAAQRVRNGPIFFAPFRPDVAHALVQELICSGRPSERAK